MANQGKSNDKLRLPGAIGRRVLAVVFLAYSAPLLLIVALLVKLEANGPVLIRCRRYLADGKFVDLWEFRTAALADNGFNAWPVETGTALGRFLRGSRLYLLPGLVNVLRGEVTFGSWFR